MAEHYPRNTVSVPAPCKKCGKITQHRVDDRRLGPCLTCIGDIDQWLKDRAEARTKPASQGNLWPPAA
jgi:hypothetical protein